MHSMQDLYVKLVCMFSCLSSTICTAWHFAVFQGYVINFFKLLPILTNAQLLVNDDQGKPFWVTARS